MDANFWETIEIIVLVIGPFFFFWYQQRQAMKRIDKQIKDGTLGEVPLRIMMRTINKVQREETKKERQKD